MRIGPYELAGLETGRFALDGGAMFGTVPRVLWSRNHPPDERNRIEMALRCLLLRTEGRNILIDTGIGAKFPEKESDIYKIDHREWTLEKALRAKDLTPDEITDVIITHLHFDHAGGSTVREDGKLRPAFPNARYHLQAENLKTADAPNLRERRSYLRENFVPLQEAGCLDLHSGGEEILPGIHLLPVSGHTDGQHLIKVEGSDGQTLVYCADLIPTSSHIAIPWVMGYDLRPLVCMREKNELLEEAARNDWYLFFEHDPKVAAARIGKKENRFTVKETVKI